MDADQEPDPGEPWLRVEYGSAWALLSPDEAEAVRVDLVAQETDAAARLAEQFKSVLQVLLSSPLHAGTRAVRVAKDERDVLVEVATHLGAPGDRFWLLREAMHGRAG
jgi:hypothetical protein